MTEISSIMTDVAILALLKLDGIAIALLEVLVTAPNVQSNASTARIMLVPFVRQTTPLMVQIAHLTVQ